MIRCKIFKLVAALLPFDSLKDRLIRGHLDRCRSCRDGLASAEEVRSILVQEEDICGLDGLWPTLERKLGGPERKDIPSRRRRGLILGFSAAGALAVMLAALLLFNIFPTRFSPSHRMGGSFEIHHIRVDNRPARTFIVQPLETDMILVWAEKSPKEETDYDM
jgi:hypothetical protein